MAPISTFASLSRLGSGLLAVRAKVTSSTLVLRTKASHPSFIPRCPAYAGARRMCRSTTANTIYAEGRRPSEGANASGLLKERTKREQGHSPTCVLFLAGSTKHLGSEGESLGHTESWQMSSMTKQKGMGWWNSDGSLQACG